VGDLRLKSAVVASLELSLRKVRGLLGGMTSDMVAFAAVLVFGFESWVGEVRERIQKHRWVAFGEGRKTERCLSRWESVWSKKQHSGAQLVQYCGIVCGEKVVSVL